MMEAILDDLKNVVSNAHHNALKQIYFHPEIIPVKAELQNNSLLDILKFAA
jgi:hypothetical protein